MTQSARNPVKVWDQRGLTLVEIMVAVTLGLILTAGLIQVFVSNKQAYRVQEGLARLQENGRFASDFITRDLRGAGFLGCAGNTTPVVNTLNSAGLLPWNFASLIQGSEATNTTAWNPALDGSIVSALGGRDVLTVRRSVGDAVPVIGQAPGAPPGSNPITVALAACPVPPNPLCDFDTPPNPIAMISDCTNAAVFQVTNPNPSGGTINHASPGGAAPGNATTDLGKDFTNTAEVVRLSTITYYVRQTGTASGRPALWHQVGGAAAQELVEGVEDMQIRYGVDADADRVPNQYLQANAVTDFNNVVSARVDLLLQSIEDNLTNAPPRYTYNGVTCPGGAGCPTDRRYRQVFGATVGLRNKML
ncbi:MAG: PilW family protein [Gammaproteobacteria bacterium]